MTTRSEAHDNPESRRALVRPHPRSVVRIALVSLLLVGLSLAAIRSAAAQPAGPTCSITDNRVIEGQDDPAFHINCTNPTSLGVQISYATGDQTATAPDDYVATSGELDVPPGPSGQGIFVDVVDDTDAEEEETFLVTLSAPDGVVTFDRQATGTIEDNDGQSDVPCILLSDTAVSVPGLAATPSQSRETRFEGLTVRNCGTDVNLEARATTRPVRSRTWQLTDYPRGNPDGEPLRARARSLRGPGSGWVPDRAATKALST